jgi:hypothetical protein
MRIEIHAKAKDPEGVGHVELRIDGKRQRLPDQLADDAASAMVALLADAIRQIGAASATPRGPAPDKEQA